ncbi:hypothetical protein K9L97_00385 [Candidatus Woesearchaeota archaeon]|nr:hypothetical protein [Candidatus Woesearchaeota archaeon]
MVLYFVFGLFMGELLKDIESYLRSGLSISDVNRKLLKAGYAESDIVVAMKSIAREYADHNDFVSNDSLSKKKYFLDRFGFGLASNQVLSVLFYLTGAGFFLIGFLNVLRTCITTFFSTFFREYYDKANFRVWFINFSGLVFGFSFLFIALAVSLGSIWLFAVSFLVGSVGVVIYGDLFRTFRESSSKGFSVLVSPTTAFFGVLLMFFGFLGSAVLMDLVPLSGVLFSLSVFGFDFSFRLHGFLIAFELTTIVFILSSYWLSRMKFRNFTKKLSFFEFKTYFIESVFRKGKRFLYNKHLLMLGLATLFLAVFQSATYSLAGVYIYSEFEPIFLGKFMNLVFVFGIPLVFSIFGPIIASRFNKYLGLSPLLVFGSVLVSFFPLALSMNSFLPALVLANLFSIFGASMLGGGNSLLASRYLNSFDRKLFYSFSSLIILIPFFVLTSVLFFMGSRVGYLDFFRIIGVGVLVFCIPIYFLLVFWARKGNLVDA